MRDWKRICCAIDLSLAARATLETAAWLARHLDAGLTLMHVVEAGGDVGRDVYAPPERIQALVVEASMPMRDLAEEAQRLRGAAVELRIVAGRPVDEILHVLREGEYDALVIGAHGRSGFGRVVFGSTAEKLVRYAPCPVLTVRPPPSV